MKAAIRSDKNIANIFRRLQGRTYLLGGSGLMNDEPFDCWGMLNEYVRLRYTYDIYSDLGTFSDIAHDYVHLYEGEPDGVVSKIKNFLDEYFNAVEVPYKRGGDIIYAISDSSPALGIYGGNDIFLITSPNTGCIIMNLSFYDSCHVYREPKVLQKGI